MSLAQLALVQRVQQVFPGVMAAAVVGVAATFLSEHYGGPVMLFALLLGMALYFLSQEGKCVPGIEFAARGLLRFAIALLGTQITLSEIMALGPRPILTVLVSVLATIVVGRLLARALGLEARFGLLTGGAVAICGASAALAISAVLPRGPNAERDTAFTVIGVTALSTVAMILYPMLVPLLALDHTAAGVFLGATIHDVAQVVGAGFSISQETGTIATFTKLLRVALLLPVVFCFTLLFRDAVAGAAQNSAGRQPPLPWFLIAFAMLVLLTSTGIFPQPVLDAAKSTSRWCLVIAISALGMKTTLKSVASVGPRAIALLVGETLFLLLLVLGLIWLEYA
ncbi:putative sulfate exporter family transporter [Ferrovibrio sp.]|uniref:YeiH family protein n=1 Tax=Ferrovibrio sp. TaxID=1917215 RepID=UPI001B6DF92F|nr:putative sulfate exporter family transporter [Ferrovibrio sp.]MBP7062551.1 putative sulfate exporter family transporter [Ferrovibrio sp.]